MKKFIQRLFLFHKYSIQTNLSKQQILDRVKSFTNDKYTDYYGSASECGFFIGEKNIKHSSFIHTRNSFAPVAKGTIVENGEVTTVSITTRMHILVLILFAPFYFISLLTVVLFPFMLLLLHFTFVRPQKRLEEEIENLLTDDAL